MSDDLDAIIAEAYAASGSNRIEYRDRIAAFDGEAIERIRPWLMDPDRGAFAVRVLGKIADLGCLSEASKALREALAADVKASVRTDIERELVRLGVAHKPPRAAREAVAAYGGAIMSVDELVVGRTYKRRDLHDSGLGGNRQKGISYPAGGDHVLLFSDPAKAAEHGYKDSWLGHDAYRYFGEWDGTGDMAMTGGNAAIRDRSPELYLFTATRGGARYEGRFRLNGTDHEPTVRDGRQFMAIAFRLSRVEPES